MPVKRCGDHPDSQRVVDTLIRRSPYVKTMQIDENGNAIDRTEAAVKASARENMLYWEDVCEKRPGY